MPTGLLTFTLNCVIPWIGMPCPWYRYAPLRAVAELFQFFVLEAVHRRYGHGITGGWRLALRLGLGSAIGFVVDVARWAGLQAGACTQNCGWAACTGSAHTCVGHCPFSVRGKSLVR